MSSPLIDRLLTEYGYPTLTKDTLEAFVFGPGERIVFLTGDPERLSHTNDVAVVIPELVAAFGGRFQVAVLDRSLEKEVMPQLGILMLPALAFLRDGRNLGVLSRMQDWDVYLAKVAEFMKDEGQLMQEFKLPGGEA